MLVVLQLKAYAWVKCERLKDSNCFEIFREAKIIGREGKAFVSEDRFVQLSLIRSQDNYDQLTVMLKNLVSTETVVADSI